MGALGSAFCGDSRLPIISNITIFRRLKMLKDIYDLYNISNKFKKDVMEQDVIGIVWSSDNGLSVHFASTSGALCDIGDFLYNDLELRCQRDSDKYTLKIKFY